MSVYRRARQPGATYFFTVVTSNRKAWFYCEDHVAVLRDAFRVIMQKRPFRMDAVVVLPDHLHCLWQLPPDDTDFSGRWREIKKRASRRLDPRTNARNERQVWQKRFWEHLIRDEKDLQNHMDYIHYNPVKHGLVKHPADWRWSSFSQAVERGWYDKDWGSSEPVGIADMNFE